MVNKSDDESDKTCKKAEEMYSCPSNKMEGLLPYYKSEIAIPKPAERLIFDEKLKEIKEPLRASKSPNRYGRGFLTWEVSRGESSISRYDINSQRERH